MKRQLINIVLFRVFLISFLWSQFALAHEGHEHAPVSIKSALEIGVKTAKNYAASSSPFAVGKLPASWASLTEADVSIYENGRGYYVVAVNNEQEAKTLYLKILLDGAIAGANYTGNFAASSSVSSISASSGG